MSKTGKLQLWNKKAGKEARRGSLAVHSSVRTGRPLGNPGSKPSRAELFLQQLKGEIRKTI